MIINRRTYIVKKGKMAELVAYLVETKKNLPVASKSRISYALFGPFDVLALEVEHENFQEYEKSWAQMADAPGIDGFMEKFDELTVPGGSNEIWESV